MAMTNALGFGFDAELDYRQERLRADFRRTRGSNRPRWWQRTPAEAVAAHRTPAEAVATPRTPAEAVAAHRTPAAVRTRHSVNAPAVNGGTVEVAPVSVKALVGSRAGTANSADDRAHAA
jgi:hypothetical protein